MAIINIPKKVSNDDNSFLGQIAKPAALVGTLATLAAPFTAGGSLAAAPAAAAATGATTASTLGAIGAGANAIGTLNSLNQKAPEAPKQATSLQSGQDNGAMARRFAEMNNNPTSHLLEAGKALNNLPPDAQEEYRPILSKAYSKAKLGGVV